jgi:hypothetical protein
MTTFRRLVCVASVGATLAMTAACGHAGAGGTGPTQPPPPPTLHGTVQSFLAASKAHLVPMAGVRVAVYRRAFPIVPVMADPPPAVAVTTTAHDGTFSFRVLPAGRYFVVADQTGHWVTLPQGQGAVANFRICGDCPKPM